MTDYLLAEFIDNINEIVKQPIHLTQRIKYTCCDVSKSFIVFGASSGGLYIFRRHPCSFDKLIPSTEGSVSHLSISPDEKLFGFATAKGTVCLVEVNNKHTDIQVYSEHIGSLITAMKWNEQSDEMFVGDTTGKLSVVINANFITKTMFQTPCSPLLQLDSRIVQIDTCCNFLLVSTISRCYLCDTEKEQYRAIGQKLRDGEYGACFFSTNGASPTSIRQKPQSGSFRILGDKESFDPSVELENFKIYCARPGLRLWEVQINSTVVRTHQFKQALNEPNIIIPVKDNDCRLELLSSQKANSQTYNFIKMYVLNNSFILSFKKDALYILDPINGRVILWTEQYNNIIDIRIIRNYIYVITEKYKLHVLLFSSLETFILKCLFNKKYLLCTDLCVKYEKQLQKLIPQSNKLHLLISLDEILLKSGELELREYLLPILNAIRLNSEARKSAKRLENGIFIVDNAHFINNTLDSQPSTSQNVELKTVEVEKERSDDLERDISRILEQYELDKAIGNYNSKVLIDVLSECNNEQIFNVFTKLEQHAVDLQVNKTDIQLWCYEKFLKYIYKQRDYVLLIFNLSLEENFWKYLLNAFTVINFCNDVCDCSFPLPKASKTVPKFLEIGRCILEKILNSDSYVDLCHKVPYLWGHVIKLQHNLSNILPLIIQYSDEDILEIFLKKFTYDHWHDALKLYILLISGKCLKCEKIISVEDCFSWDCLTIKILKSVGAESTVELLLQYSDDVPPSALGTLFYQCTIFSSLVENYQPNLRMQSIDFVNKMHGCHQKGDFEKLLEKTLQSPASSMMYHKPNFSKTDEKCCGCNMPLQTPVLHKEKQILKCDHAFHGVCLKYQNNICNICNTVI